MTDETTVQRALNTIRTLSSDAAQQAKSGLMIGVPHDEFIHVPIDLLVGRRKSIDPTDPLWGDTLAATGQLEQL